MSGACRGAVKALAAACGRSVPTLEILTPRIAVLSDANGAILTNPGFFKALRANFGLSAVRATATAAVA